MDRIACVCLPEFPLQLLLRRQPTWHALPCAVVDRDKAQGVLLWVNEHARRLRILPGMRYASGLSLSPKLHAAEVSESEIADGVAQLVERLYGFTAEVEASEHEQGVFWLNAAGLTLLYPSLRKWSELIVHNLSEAGFHASIATGFTRFGTYAVARSTNGALAFEDIDHERKTTASVPIDRIGVDPDLRDALFKLGITTIGAFLELPGNGVKKRFGEDVHRLYRLAKNALYAPLVPQPPREAIRDGVHLDHAEQDLGRLMAVVERLLGGLFKKLGERCEVLASVSVGLTFDDGTGASERLEPATPTLDAAQVLDLIRLRLGSLSFPCGVGDIAVEIEGRSASLKQGELFVEKSPRDTAAAARAFARIRAEFGDDTVVRATLSEGHLPEAHYEWAPMAELPAPRARNVRLPPLVRRIFAQPVMFSPGTHRGADAQLTAHIDNGSVRETQGPYIVSGGWWQREVRREYYFVTTSSGRSLWMFYDRTRLSWYIHGEVS